jgi:cytochrome c-type biogenesis protein CcmH
MPQDTDIAARERVLRGKLVASCCWSEPLTVHRSGTADEMRDELRAMLLAGRSNQDILDAFRRKYGKRVLIEPEGGASTLIYAVPGAAAVVGAAAAAIVIRRWLRSRPADDVSAVDLNGDGGAVPHGR